MTNPGNSTDKPQGKLAAVFAIFAFIACNGLVIMIAAFSLIGVSISINPHIQAAAISLFAVVTLGLVFNGFKKNRRIGPLILATGRNRHIDRYHVYPLQQNYRIPGIAGTLRFSLVELADQPNAVRQ